MLADTTLVRMCLAVFLVPLLAGAVALFIASYVMGA